MKIVKYIALCLSIALPVMAQTGSVYSRFGAGELSASNSARYTGLNDAGSAVIDRDYLSPLNPASWSGLNFTRIETGVNYRGYRISETSEKAYYSLLQFSGFSLGVPLQRSWGLTLGGGIHPYSRLDYEIMPSSAQVNPAPVYNASFSGKGGITRSYLGLSYSLYDFSLGATLDYYIGNFKYVTTVDMTDEARVDFNYTRNNKLNGLGGTFGIISADFARLLGIEDIRDMRLAFTYQTGGDYNGDTSLTLSMNDGYYDPQLVTSGKNTVTLPSRMTLGASARISDTWLVVLDYLYQPWSNYRFSGLSDQNLRNRNRYSAALEYRKTDRQERTFLKNLAVRGGFSYEQTQFIIRGKELNQLSASAGLSFPLDYENTLDISFMYGLRGTTDSGLMKENIYGMNISVSLGEPWFLRR